MVIKWLENQKKNEDKFEVLKRQLIENFYETRKKLEEKEQKSSRGRNAEIMKIELDIKEKINQSEELLKKTNECLREQARSKVIIRF